MGEIMVEVITEAEDRSLLSRLPVDKILDLFLLHIRNLWRVDGLYFLGIEEKFGTEAATEIDANTWKILAKIEAKDLKRTLGITEVNDVKTALNLLRNTSWSLYQTSKGIQISEDGMSGIFRVISCKVQEARLRKGLQVFPCKVVRFGYLKSFAQELNPNLKVECLACPPDPKPPTHWCEWKFYF